MLIDCGKDDYRNLVTESDFVDVIREKISNEFAKEISEWFEEADHEIDYLREEIESLSKELNCLEEHLNNISN